MHFYIKKFLLMRTSFAGKHFIYILWIIGCNEHAEEDYLAGRRNWKAERLSDVNKIKGRPSDFDASFNFQLVLIKSL